MARIWTSTRFRGTERERERERASERESERERERSKSGRACMRVDAEIKVLAIEGLQFRASSLLDAGMYGLRQE